MTEILFILTTIFVAYVIYVFVSERKTTSDSQASQAKPEKPLAEAKIIASAISNSEPTTAPQDNGKRGLKDPKTGEVTTTYNNYRFTKRWIKEALVAEGLLDKVYKNDELNADIGAKIKRAVLKLEAIDKYRI